MCFHAQSCFESRPVSPVRLCWGLLTLRQIEYQQQGVFDCAQLVAREMSYALASDARVDCAGVGGCSAQAASGSRKSFVQCLDRACLEQARNARIFGIASPHLGERDRWDRRYKAARICHCEDLAIRRCVCPYHSDMATRSALAGVDPHLKTRWRGRKRVLIGFAIGAIVLVAIATVVVLVWSGVSLTGDATALAHVSVQPFGGKIERVEAYAPGGHKIPLSIERGKLTPLQKLKPGEHVFVDVVVRRPALLSWALGNERTEHLTLTAPVAHVTERWMTVQPGADVRVGFDRPVSSVIYGTDRKSVV